ncbi:hypothetical protein LOK49_LG09G00479 [Camellia lanceoleosa]|uniref:Uncharacterized protein n=1 Tax=Camellia lanceoleosa TaxID=1840588 RepID=A0ACC0GJK2_9ERIC|nr:hypothetical protein LOK49_LG09G00479 [Camellia lanceoleosa]
MDKRTITKREVENQTFSNWKIESSSSKETASKDPLEAVGSKVNGALQNIQHKPTEGEDDDKAAEVAGDVAGEPDLTNGVVTSRLKGKGELVVEGSWSNTSAVAETIFCAGNSYEVGTCAAESSLQAVCLQQRCNQSAQKGDGNQLDTAIGTLQQSVQCNPIPLKGAPIAYLTPTIDGQFLTPAIDGQLPTPGFIRSLSDPSKERPGICLEVNLGNGNSGLQPTKLAQVNLQPMGPLSYSSPTAEEALQSKTINTTSPSLPGPIRNRPKKWKRKGSRCDKIKHQLLAGRFSGFTRRLGHKGANTSKGIIKGAKSGSSAEPISSNSVSARDILQEAHATLKVGESLGFDFKGQEAEVIQKLTHMEEQDKESFVLVTCSGCETLSKLEKLGTLSLSDIYLWSYVSAAAQFPSAALSW